MKKQFLSIAILASATAAYGQVGINTTAPATTLDIIAKNPTGTTTAVDGLMIPRVDRQRAQSMTSVPTSTMIYVNDISTGAASGIAVNIDATGFYFYNGTAWTKMGAGASASAVTANNGLTQASGNIQLGGALTQATTISGLSATNTMALTGAGVNAFSVDGNTLSVDADNNRIGIGTAAPLLTLHVNDGSTSGMANVFGKGIGVTSSSSSRIYLEALGSSSGQRVFQLSNENGVFGVYPLSDNAGATVPVSSSAPSIGVKATTGKVGILNANPAATFDIAARTATGTDTAVDGVLIPRVDRQRAQSMTSVPASTMIYINDISTGSASGTAVNIDATGFYYYNGTAWTKMGAGAYTANNGLTATANNVQLGGALTQATTISGLSATNTLNISGGPLRLLNGGVSNAVTGNEQLLLGYSASQNYKHAIKTRHNNLGKEGNAIDFYTWKSGTDALTDTGTQLVMTLDGNGYVGIGNLLPKATMDITATASTGTATGVDGLLIPRVDRQRAASMTSVPTSTMVYVNSVATGAASGTTANVDAIGFYYFDGSAWQKLGGSSSAVPYQNIRGNVNVLPASTLSYTLQANDYMVVTTASSGVTITLPTLTAADAGRIVLLYNDNSATSSNTYSGIDAGAASPNPAKGRTATLIWTGTKWITASAQ